MDFLTLIKDKDRIEYASSYNYNFNFMGQKLFPQRKTKNLKVEAKRLMENGGLPVMAQIHALDTEARIGDRPNIIEFEAVKLLIKEKLNQGEKLSYYLADGSSNDELIKYVYDDMGSLMSRCITRTEVANMELLSTGALTINENNINIKVDYNLPLSNMKVFKDWNVLTHDIVGDLNAMKKAAKAKGITLSRAITSSDVLDKMLANTAISTILSTNLIGAIPTIDTLKTWLFNNFKIEFIENDEYYKTSANGLDTFRFYPADRISFLGTRAAIGEGLFGVTPSELQLIGSKAVDSMTEKMFCTITQWATQDPATTWTMSEAIYLPVPKDINQLFIAKII